MNLMVNIMGLPKKNKSKLKLNQPIGGVSRKYDIINESMDINTFLPSPVNYIDIDGEFVKWVTNELKITYNGSLLPTMSLFSNQRFSEYTQSWDYVDDNKNIIMNFKTINKDNDSSFGDSQGKNYNIPGEPLFTIGRKVVLNDGGFETFVDYKMKQPYSINIKYTLNIVSDNINLIYEFNNIVNNKFKSRQCYISPNNYYMPLHLEGIGDESEYNINDRQFYKQSYDIVIYAYIINEEDLIIEQIPSRQILCFEGDNGRPIVDIEENDNFLYNDDNDLYYKPIYLNIDFSTRSNTVKFTIDTNFTIIRAEVININKYDVYINDEIINSNNVEFNNGDEIKIKIKRGFIEKSSLIKFIGYDKNIIYSENKNNDEMFDSINQSIGQLYINN